MPYPRLVNRNWTRSQLKPDIAQQKCTDSRSITVFFYLMLSFQALQTETLSIPGILDDMFGHFKACAISPFLRLLGGSKRENAWSAGSPALGTFFHHPTRVRRVFCCYELKLTTFIPRISIHLSRSKVSIHPQQ